MAWIKRNLYFVIMAAIGLAVTGYCGYLLYAALAANTVVGDEYTRTVDNLKQLQQKKPFPDKANIASAKADQERVRQFLADFHKAFQPFPIPLKEDDRGFKDYLQGTIYQLSMEASNAGVLLPADYAFSFSDQRNKLSYNADCIAPWMEQLEEIKVILHILYRAKINYLEGLQRCTACGDDSPGYDCLQVYPTTNQWGVVTPYKVMFRGFSTEVAAVLAGFAGASNCFIVKDIDVTQSKAALPQVVTPPPTPQPVYIPQPVRPNPYLTRPEGRMSRENPGEYRRPTPQPVQAVPAPVAPAGPETILTESLLFVTLSVDVVKLK
jgi:hypothetical protein